MVLATIGDSIVQDSCAGKPATFASETKNAACWYMDAIEEAGNQRLVHDSVDGLAAVDKE